ncbi:MAG: acetyl-CoA C-acyltransferase [Flavobacteriales bacterium]|nr:acetyl-CoA C-acyltransferase [Flavobacteriales bacterium]
MEAYIVQAKRTAIGKSKKGGFRFMRPDDMAADLIRKMMTEHPQLNKDLIDDVIVGNATPEAEQGLNIGRIISLLGLNTVKVPGMTINRFCSSGLESIAIAVAKIKSGMADCIIAGGVETMSPIPFGGWRIVPNYSIAKNNPDWYWGMGTTAEAVAKSYKINREDQDEFAFNSHKKAINAISNGLFKKEIVPITVTESYLDENEKKIKRDYIIDTDEGARKDTTIEKLSKLRPVFAQKGTVTAGNSSQVSDGASFVFVMSEKLINKLNIKPIAKLLSYQVAGVEPKHMGIGPIEAIPKALNKINMNINDIELIELNEAFASQSLAIIRELNLNNEIINVNGGAIALGHPLGCTGAKLSTQIIHELKRRNQKYGMVSMCVGTGQGAAGIFELIN